MDNLDPPHHDLTFMSPLSEVDAERLVAFLAEDLVGTIVDTGCGWGELLLRTASRAPEARALGLDEDEEALAHGRVLAQERGLGDRVRLVSGDAAAQLPAHADALICIGASQIWATSDAPDRVLDYRSALTALREALEPGGRLVYGEAIWSRPPTTAAAAPLAGRLDEFVDLPTLLELAVEVGFQPILTFEASQNDWDVFESGYAAAYGRWLAAHPADHPDAERVRERAAEQRAGYFDGYRGIMGLAYLALVAD